MSIKPPHERRGHTASATTACDLHELIPHAQFPLNGPLALGTSMGRAVHPVIQASVKAATSRRSVFTRRVRCLYMAA